MPMITDSEQERLDFEKLVEILEAVGLEPVKYSGRAMYGKHCVAVHTDNGDGAAHVAVKVMGALASDGLNPNGSYTPLQACELIQWFDNEAGTPSEDSLGHGRVVYWKAIAWHDPVEEDGDSEEEKRADHDYDQRKDDELICKSTSRIYR